jgi:hypothetical protein
MQLSSLVPANVYSLISGKCGAQPQMHVFAHCLESLEHHFEEVRLPIDKAKVEHYLEQVRLDSVHLKLK